MPHVTKLNTTQSPILFSFTTPVVNEKLGSTCTVSLPASSVFFNLCQSCIPVFHTKLFPVKIPLEIKLFISDSLKGPLESLFST